MVARYTQPVVQTVPGPVFQVREVPLFRDPHGKWVLYEDVKHFISLGERYPMQAFQQRVIDEKNELDERLQKLVAFIAKPAFEDLPPDERQRMIRQRRIMQDYSDVLGERIKCFSPN